MTLSLERVQQMAQKTGFDLSFLDALLGRGVIRSELLTTDPTLQEKIRSHPMLNCP